MLLFLEIALTNGHFLPYIYIFFFSFGAVGHRRFHNDSGRATKVGDGFEP